MRDTTRDITGDQVIETTQDSTPGSEETQDDSSTDSSEEVQLSSTIDSIQQPSTSARVSNHVTVHRDEISSTRVQEGDEELQDLGVDVYDQQTYEKSVFDQVDRAITDNDASQKKTNKDVPSGQSSNIDLLQLIQGQSDQAPQEDVESLDAQDKDEQVIRLTRLERLNRVTVKSEPVEKPCDDIATHLPRIPRISVIPKREPEDPQPSTSRQYIPIKPEPIDDMVISDDDSSASEYRPEPGEILSDEEDDDGLEDDIDYETDNELGGAVGMNDDDDVEPRSSSSKKIKDDGDFKSYSARIKAYNKVRAKKRLDNILDDGTELEKLDEMVTIDGSLKIPKEMWNNLYEHQRTGVRWLWELHQLGTGGILGDEMGLGKTIQMIAFLTALRTSNIVDSHKGFENLGPTVLVCPATVMHQWLLELRKWYPAFRVAILHSTGTFCGDRKQLVKVIHKSRGILICSYPGVIIYQDFLHALDWHYAVLDEGHKIRNPDAQVTLACKRFRTPHRIILSGSPVQNNLKELWSIFDFIYPGKLGTLPVFMGQFSIPITQGGYANATDMQVQIAYKCACVLRDTIKPFLLRRTKAEVNNKLKLPDRSEQVLFCKLTEKQRKLYQHYLDSPTVRDIKMGLCQIFVGLIQLRKICNHPDLFDASECDRQQRQKKLQQEKRLKHMEFFSVDETYGHYQKSGKMMVVDALLKLWKKQGHKVLLFTQSRQMLKLFSTYLNDNNYKYLTMDGSTAIGIRQNLVEEFNTQEDIFVFLLTTRVGGVGVNLIGANRIIIFDPDWNPSTDIQARERAWRIGQTRHVIIYRLLTAGTIEEKIYHRQVFKLYLTNRILKDAKQKRFFKTNDMHELFTLGHDDKNIETKALFDDDLQIDEKSIKKSKQARKLKKEKRKHKKRKLDENQLGPIGVSILSEEKLQEMRERAKKLSQMIANQYGGLSSNGETTNSRQDQIEIGSDPEKNAPLSLTNSTSSTSTANGGLSKDKTSSDRTSPTQAVPYCPGVQGFGVVDTSGLQSTSKSKKSKGLKQKVDYLVKQDIYRPGGDAQGEDADPRYRRDDYILERLFKKSNISGALKHDRIESDSTADFKVVESEAEKVARDAIRALRDSRRYCLSSTSGIPNWTGQNGQMSARPRLMPKNRSRLQQPSTSSGQGGSLLSSIRNRNQSNPVNMAGRQTNDPLESDDDETDRDFQGKAKSVGADQMADKIREFVLYKSSTNGEAQTEELLDFFRNNFSPDKTAIFKAILYKICEFHRRADKGFWIIRSEFRSLM